MEHVFQPLSVVHGPVALLEAALAVALVAVPLALILPLAVAALERAPTVPLRALPVAVVHAAGAAVLALAVADPIPEIAAVRRVVSDVRRAAALDPAFGELAVVQDVAVARHQHAPPVLPSLAPLALVDALVLSGKAHAQPVAVAASFADLALVDLVVGLVVERLAPLDRGRRRLVVRLVQVARVVRAATPLRGPPERVLLAPAPLLLARLVVVVVGVVAAPRPRGIVEDRRRLALARRGAGQRGRRGHHDLLRAGLLRARLPLGRRRVRPLRAQAAVREDGAPQEELPVAVPPHAPRGHHRARRRRRRRRRAVEERASRLRGIPDGPLGGPQHERLRHRGFSSVSPQREVALVKALPGPSRRSSRLLRFQGGSDRSGGVRRERRVGRDRRGRRGRRRERPARLRL
mmetsp:Transcript_27992/g.84154  ORF Transcript_27992/g.84154 Transcript_27992/m.84154 type:complete len:406 (+) Transcript_27992:320-1537(+)